MSNSRTLRTSCWWAAFITTLAGIASSTYLLVLHFRILKSGFLGETLCDISPYFNCTSVLMSRFAEIGPIPLSGLGLIFYLYLLGALIWSRVEPEKAGATLGIPYLLIIVSFILSLSLAYVSAFELKSFCLFCSSLYIVNLLLLIFVKLSLKLTWSEWMKQLKNFPWIKNLAYFAIVFAIGSILLYTGEKQFAQEIPQAKLDQYFAAFFKQPVEKIDIEGRPFWGNPEAKIIVTEFSDFECPYCKRASKVLKPILKQYQDQVKFVFFHYPLDQSCNPSMQRSLHRRACAAAYASYCAGEQGKFWEYEEKAFDRQPKFQEASLLNMAEKIDLDLPKFKACLTSDAAKQAITADLAIGQAVKLRGTPSVYVNGRKFAPWMSRRAWKQLLEKINAQP